MAARQDMLGLSFTNTDALVLPYGGKEPFLGTNPFCFAAPCEGEEPFCLDMSTSVINWNKLRLYWAAHKPLEAGWAADQDGKMCSDPQVAQALLPIGSYKGYGLGLVVEILCSLLTNMPYGPHISKMFPLSEEKRHLGHFLMALDVSKFQKISLFKRMMKQLLDELRSMVPAEGFDRVRVANDPEKEAYLKRSVDGIPISQEELENFRELAHLLEIDVREYSALFV
jgi:ureidoglycolate dehydrogenase (NAD+)